MNESLALLAQDVFVLAAPTGWPRPTTEIQESEILLMVNLPEDLSNIKLTKVERTPIVLALNALMPSSEPLGIWTVCIYSNGKVVDSILANDL
jgi:hypothetical protein